MIPGFWLNGDSWMEVAGPLRAAGHTVHPLTLPGLESLGADRSDIGLRDHVEAVIAVVDSLEPGVVLVGHSGGGEIAHAVADARPSAIARVVYVDSFPLGNGGMINDELPVVDGEIPLPDWDEVFDDDDLADMSPAIREHFRSVAVPQPRRVASDKQMLRDPRRYEVPVTVICCVFTAGDMAGWIEAGREHVAELAQVIDYEFVDLPTGHWPQFTKPVELSRAILAAVDR